MDDHELVEELRRGDEAAVEHIVQEYAPALYRFVYFQLQDPVAAEDLVSEVLVRMVRKMDEFDPEQDSPVSGRTLRPTHAFRAWLFRIARNLIADHYRSLQHRPHVSLEAILSEEPANEPGGQDPSLESVFERDRLQAGLLSLMEAQRQVIILHVIDGWDLPQVAEMLDRTLPSVKSLYYRGIHSLRRALLRDGSDENLG